MTTPPTTTPWQPYADYLAARQAEQLYRQLPEYPTALPLSRDFTSNDYLGLSQHPAVITAMQQAAKHYGAGGTGSRLLSGNRHAVYTELEERIASSKGQESALLFASGYQCNATVLPALLNKNILGYAPVVLADKLIHASMLNGLLASGVAIKRHPHKDYAALEMRLKQHAQAKQPCWIVTESVFSMDGDTEDLATIQRLAKKYSAYVYVDEAHATGLYGPQGYGLTTTVDWGNVPLVTMGTFSKTLGGQGAYVACNAIVKDYLINACSGFVYSTALSPVLAAGALAAWQLLPSLGDERDRVQAMAQQLRKGLNHLSLQTIEGTSPIVPAIMGDVSALLAAKQTLHHAGVMVAGIRPPTVPHNTARLRFSVTVHHQASHITDVLAIMADIAPSLTP